MNWNRQEEAPLNERINYVFFGCSDINPVRASRQWHVSELYAKERKCEDAVEGKKRSILR